MKDEIKQTMESVDREDLRQAAKDGGEQVEEWRVIARDLLVAYRVPLSILFGTGFISLTVFRVLTGEWPRFIGTIWSVIAALAGYAIYVVPIGGGLGALLFYAIGEDDTTRVLDIHPLYGRGEHAVSVMDMGSEVWASMTVVNTSGEKVPKDHLNKIEFVKSRDDEGNITKVTEGYEVMGYDRQSNTATATYLGESSLEMRRYEKLLERIEQKLLTMADWGVEELLDQPLVARMIAARVTRYLVYAHAKATVPNGEEVTSMARDVLEDLGYDEIESLEQKLEDDLPDNTPNPREQGHSFDYAHAEGDSK